MTDALIGRALERSRLHALLANDTVRAVFVRGPAGVGKTALIRSVLEEAASHGALCGSGTYAEGGDAAFGPILRALSELVGAALDQLYDPDAGVASLRRTLGPNLTLLHAAGLRLDDPPPPKVGSSSWDGRLVTARITAAILALMRWLSGFGSPLVLFIDDWRRGSAGARACLAALAGSGGAAPGARFTLVLAEREPDAAARPSEFNAAPTLRLGGLDLAERAELLSRELGPQAGRALATWLDGDGPVLPFDLLQTARTLRELGGVSLGDTGWTVTASAATAALGPEALETAVRRRLSALSAEGREVALSLALWGDRVSPKRLALALGRREAELDRVIEALLAVGLALYGEGALGLPHDRLRVAVLDAFDAGAAARAAAVMAERLRAAGPIDDIGWTAALRLRLLGGVDAADPRRWRDALALGAVRARDRADLSAAAAFAEAAWSLHGRDPAVDPAALVRLRSQAVLAAADRQDSAEVLERLRPLLADEDAGSLDALGDAYRLGVTALRLAGDADRAWSLAVEGLHRFGLRQVDRADRRGLLSAVAIWRLERLRPRRAGRQPWVAPLARVADAAATLAYERDPMLAALVAFRTSARVRAYADDRAYWLGVDAFLAAVLGEWDQAARLGQSALDAVGPGDWGRGATMYRALYWGLVWRRRNDTLRERCREVRDAAVAEGDLIAAGACVRNEAMIGWRSAPSLAKLERELDQARADAAWLQDPQVNAGLDDLRDVVATVRSPDGEAALRRRLTGVAVGPDAHLLEVELASLLGDWALADQVFTTLQPLRRGFDNHPFGVVWRFHESLARLQRGRAARPADVAFVRKAARLNPADHGHKLQLLRAETLRLRGNKPACLAAYADVVASADAGPSRLEAGVAAECAAAAARGFTEPALAAAYAEKAVLIWANWGARFKAC